MRRRRRQMEKVFKKRVMAALSKKRVSTIDLKSGTFDLFLDEGKRCFLELKIANRHFKPHETILGINLSTQTTALRQMKKMPPIVLARNYRHANECYLALPKDVRKLVKKRLVEWQYQNVLIGIEDLQPPLSFDKAMTKIIRYLKGL